MKKKNLLLLLPFLALAACSKQNNNSSSMSSSSSIVEEKIELDSLITLLETNYLPREISSSSKVVFEETDMRGEDRLYTTNETLSIYDDETSYAIGKQKYEYIGNSTTETVTDNYYTINTTKTYNNQKVFYKVTDYEDGTLNASWQDSAYRLPVYASGDESQNGVTYLLQSSVASQLSQQVSLRTRNFIASYLTGNPDVALALPRADVTKTNEKTVYSIDNFTYSYSDDDDSTTEVLIGFEITITPNNRLVESKTLYQTTSSRDDESYVQKLESHYVVSYDERVSSTTVADLINPEDYFLMDVDEVKAFVYTNGTKEYVDVNNLPLNSYIHFEASVYTPSKAVDLTMSPVSSSNTDVVSISSTVFETLKTGEATLMLESATGVQFEVDVRVNIPAVLSISYVDTYSGIEIGYDENSNKVRYIYTDTTYTNINVSVRPSAALVEDIEIIVSDESVLNVTIDTQNSNANLLSLKYEVLKNNDEKVVSVTFQSKIKTDIKETITYNIKDRLSTTELIEKLTTHTYKWTNIYDKNTYSLMTFENESQGTISYYSNDECLQTVTFTYEIEGSNFIINMNTFMSPYEYDGGEITLDGEEIILSVNVTDYVHRYEVLDGVSS